MNIYCKHSSKELASRIKQMLSPVPLENVTTFRDIEDEVTDFVRNGFKTWFYKLVYHNFDKIFSTYTRAIYYSHWHT